MLVLSGGTGTPKLLRGLEQLLEPEDLTVVVNTAEDGWISGNLVTPDIDTVLYTLAHMVDESRWWGIEGDSFTTHDLLTALGARELLAIGDKDRAMQIYRSSLIRAGKSKTEATGALARALGVKQKVIPMSDDEIATIIETPKGDMPFQEFWVGLGGRPNVDGIRIEGLDVAHPSPAFAQALAREEVVLIGPSNPVTSTGPILALPGVKEALFEKTVIAISPLQGNRPFSGPAAKFMAAVGVEVSDAGVASLLGSIDLFLVSPESGYDGPCVRLRTAMRTAEDSLNLAREVLELITSS